MKHILIPIAHGSEEIETACIYSVLARAGNSVRLSSIYNTINNDLLTLSRGMNLKPDSLLKHENHMKYDMIVMAGGFQGAKCYNQCDLLKQILQERKQRKMHYAAICATPGLFLAPNQLLLSKATGYPSFKDNIIKSGYMYENKDFVKDDFIITGRGPGDALSFSLKIVEILNGHNKRNEVQTGLLL